MVWWPLCPRVVAFGGHVKGVQVASASGGTCGACTRYGVRASRYRDALCRICGHGEGWSRYWRQSLTVTHEIKLLNDKRLCGELCTPLNAIIGLAQLMTRSSRTDDEQKSLAVILRSGEHLLALINQVLDLSKIEAGQTGLNEEDFDLQRLLDDVYSMLWLEAQNKGLLLTFERADDVPQWVRGDDVKLRQVLINLLNNAVKFTPKGRVKLTLKACRLDIDAKEELTLVVLSL